ncbi:hypothetical protein DA075_26755 [Methylobacterium currus]|uniref:Neuroendocrine-specific golgi family protein P55 (NESP55) n=1 Tax=Methylobacterium currus TaxID=2051553 RepID=A0A2R4WR60_9HYPH|nr:hypothetical protein [Methylobacterium currus]AWB24037.1 hypothetical protein DA075_26755 [Methylobacterium currus]UHC15861.1 hypothetical protein LRS73_25800 [Methylobacterium currus]
MREYLVTFHKVVLDDTGHDRRVLQQQAVVSAPCETSALALAKTRFCEAAGIVDWRLRADSCDVAVLSERAA